MFNMILGVIHGVFVNNISLGYVCYKQFKTLKKD